MFFIYTKAEPDESEPAESKSSAAPSSSAASSSEPAESEPESEQEESSVAPASSEGESSVSRGTSSVRASSGAASSRASSKAASSKKASSTANYGSVSKMPKPQVSLHEDDQPDETADDGEKPDKNISRIDREMLKFIFIPIVGMIIALFILISENYRAIHAKKVAAAKEAREKRLAARVAQMKTPPERNSFKIEMEDIVSDRPDRFTIRDDDNDSNDIFS